MKLYNGGIAYTYCTLSKRTEWLFTSEHFLVAKLSSENDPLDVVRI